MTNGRNDYYREWRSKNRELIRNYQRSWRSLHPSWNVWTGMVNRCERSAHKFFKYYGGRGIKVCKKWRESFYAFEADMGPRPLGLTLDRIDNDRGYEPGNVRWATRKEQVKNRRINQRDERTA